MSRFAMWEPETVYGTAPATLRNYVEIAGESLKRKPDLASHRAGRSMTAERQNERRRSVAGGVDPYVNYITIGQHLALLVNTPTAEDRGSGAFRYTFVPDQAFRPAGSTWDVARDLVMHRHKGLFPTAGRFSFSTTDRHMALALQMLGADEAEGAAIPAIDPSIFSPCAALGSSASATPLDVTVRVGDTVYTLDVDMIDIDLAWNRRLRTSSHTSTPQGVMGGGLVSAAVKLRWIYDDSTAFLMGVFRERTSVAITVTLQGELIGGGIYEELEFYFPVCKMNGDPPTLKGQGFGNLDFTAANEALLSRSAGYPFRVRVTNLRLPAVPGGLVATAGAEIVDLAWDAVVSASSYTVKRALVTGGPYTDIGDMITELMFTDTGLTNGTEYFYVVSATNSTGEGPDSDEDSATPVGVPAVGDELLVNGSFEDAPVGGEIPGWTEVLGTTWQRAGLPSWGAPPPGGSYMAYPGTTWDGSGMSELRQDVDVSVYAAAIDAGTKTFEWSSYGSAKSTVPWDECKLIIESRSAGGTVLNSYSTNIGTYLGSWRHMYRVWTPPVLTRTIRARLRCFHKSGTTNDAYHDACSLKALT